MKKIILRNIKAPITNTEQAAVSAASGILKKEGVPFSNLTLCKKSLDARKKNEIHYVCSVIAECEALPSPKKLKYLDACELIEGDVTPHFGSEKLTHRPLVVGFGPAGMMCAMMLAENGYAPIVIERGESVRKRALSVEAFYKSGRLNTESNIQFGAGGAGTFSDGKLVTRINDLRTSYVLSRLVELGAPEDIKINAKPHIGTDLLVKIVENAAEYIQSRGGEIRYNTKMLKINTDSSGRAVSVLTNNGEIACSALVLAIGHSARDSYDYLIKQGYTVIPKAFSVGVRVEHLQEDISYALYKDNAPLLPPGEYSLSKREGERGVYSFCMCPGGEVVAGASEEGTVVTNGMSANARNLKNANSAIAVSILQSDFGGSAEGAISFQRELEKRAFAAGGGDYKAPLQTMGDFMSGTRGSEPTKVSSTYMGGDKFTLCDLNEILPPYVCEMLKIGFADFGKKIEGFDAPYALLTGVESRTSAPVRIVRNSDLTAVGHSNIYPSGEGAGYAGGITSAALDGLSCALEIMKKYAKFEQ